ncbi:MAG: translation initiation factor IF-2 [Candidatus Nealsonbacteria bacterium CG23_combo_of_CG06-09_8_20_14_all_37_18]|uniref:Translation initiation factor IF-2 n=1 Tax=Candidatus Nealsonbacteria bacterium CG23_combo_of_CG06-09_8_20_14_all_37_18 TaxID=1974720 RepID=A0A2G9YY85_9BACT|nr:MAG: translation initiation factor IF-2 [Candidatus Nealsonbacteria bacterium CG23_combo_of_CG06-09_8_20_14_all_37_18]
MMKNQKTTTRPPEPQREGKKKIYPLRPPIVVVLGHIDHGKSSLLEAIRDFKITEKESGGITQHIGAYQVEEQGGKITFLDTPGHEAFSQMRSRGAKVADIAVLVIDAAEGVKSQTKEAISHIKGARIPAIIALNKIDKPEANPEKVKRELSQEGFLVESLGGKIPSLEISAKTKKGIPELLELILLVAEMEELEADPQKPGEGVVVESYLDNLRGPTATLLLTDGHLKIGDIVGTNSAFARIKSIENFQKIAVEKAFPSDAVIIFGFNQAPKVGEKFEVFPDMENAENHIKISESEEDKSSSFPFAVAREEKVPEVLEITGQQRVLNLILKTDVLGSAEAIEGILKSLPQEKVILKILKSAAGNINESDIKLALSSRATILGFRVKIDFVAQKILEREESKLSSSSFAGARKREKVRVLVFDIIYDLIEGARKSMERIVEPEEVRTDLGKVKVLVKFLTEKNRQIIGGRVTEGKIRKGAMIEVFRGTEEKIGQGKMINLQRNKKDIDEVQKGDECGILFEGNVTIEEGDILLFYIEEKRKGQL